MKNHNIESILNLYNLLQETELNSKMSLSNNVLTILFHENFKVEIVCNNNLGLFHTYINSLFYYGIEEMDIFDFIKDLSNKLIIVQYKKARFFKRPFKFINIKSFNENYWKNKKNIKIYNSTKLILDNFI